MILDSMARPIRMACIHRIGNTDIEMWCDEIAGPTYGFLIAWLYLYIDITMLSKNICMYIYIYVHISQSHHYPFIILSSFIIDPPPPPPPQKKKKKKKKEKKSSTCSLSFMSDSWYKNKAKANTYDLSMATGEVSCNKHDRISITTIKINIIKQ